MSTTAQQFVPENLTGSQAEVLAQIAKQMGIEGDLEATEADEGEERQAEPAKQEDVKQEGEPSDTQKEGDKEPGKEAEEPTSIKSPKGVEIPYAVLKEERGARRAAQARIAELEARITELSNAAKTGEQAEQTGEVEGLSEEELAELENDLPHLGKALRSLQGKVGKLESENAKLREATKQEQRDEMQDEVAAALASNPILSKLSATLSPEQWNARVVAADEILRANPELKELTLAQRFEKLAAGYEATYGKVGVEAPKPQPKPKAKAAKLDDELPVQGLSDLPGGTPPTSDESPGALSPRALEARMSKMSPDQMSAFLARFAG